MTQTLYRARVFDTPDNPFAGGTTASERHTPTPTSSTCAMASSCPASSTPTCTIRRSA